MSSVEIINSSDVLDRFGLVVITPPCNSLFDAVVKRSDLKFCGEIDDYPIVFREVMREKLLFKVCVNESFDRLTPEEKVAALGYVFSKDLSKYDNKAYIKCEGIREVSELNELTNFINEIFSVCQSNRS